MICLPAAPVEPAVVENMAYVWPLDQLAAFLRTHLPHTRECPDLHALIAWYISKEAIGVVHHRGEILGLGLVRVVSSPGDAAVEYRWDERGQYIVLDQAVIRHRAALPALWDQCRARFGRRRAVVFTRAGRPERYRVYPYASFQRRIQQESQSHGR